MSLLVADNLAKSFGADDILAGAGFRLEWRTKMGLVGRNGSGKTTLLRLLTGDLVPDRGTATLARGVRAGYLRQEDAVDPERTVIQEAERAFDHVLQMESRLRDLEREMAGADESALPRVLEEYSLLRDRFEAMGGYDNLRDIPAVLRKLEFGAADLDRKCRSLSGGEKTRLAIARVLLSGPDILLLDEPTNHLDIDATEWLESFLHDFGGAAIIVSHDRYFLDRVATSIAEIDTGILRLYPGNYSAFLTQKQASRLREAAVYKHEQREIAKSMAFYEKWKDTPSKRRQAQMHRRWAERVRARATTPPPRTRRAPRLALRPDGAGSDDAVMLDRIAKRYGDRVLFENLSLLVRRCERVAIMGPNGSGKTTLVKLILGRETATSGMTRVGVGCSVGYFAQDTGELDSDATVLENMLSSARMTPEQARTYLGSFLFTGDDALRPVRLLSGGEKNKLALAQILYKGPNVLILDEPTNHLDLESCEALAQMLCRYEGTLLLVSHDRWLIDQTTERTIYIADGRVFDYDSPYSECRDRILADRQRPAPAAALKSKPAGTSATDGSRGRSATRAAMNAHELTRERRRLKSLVGALEVRITALEDRVREIEAVLSHPSAADNIIALAQEYDGARSALAAATEEWARAAADAEEMDRGSRRAETV